MAAVRFWVLGPVTATAATGAVTLGGPRQRAVLALLLAHPSRTVPVSDLVDGVWNESPPPSAERTLHAYIARLRTALEPGRASGDPRLLERTSSGYRLTLGPDDLDALAFEADLATARRLLAAGDADSASDRLRSALQRWRGDAFADLLDFPTVQAAAQRLDQLRADAIVDGVTADLSLGRHERLLPSLRNLVADHPFDERLWAALALAYYRQGQQSQALAAISHARQVLAEELGIDPGPALRTLQEQILVGDPRLELPEPTGSHAARRDHPGLEGREDALRALRAAWTRVAGGSGETVVVTGPAGIGRTRLLRAFAAEVRSRHGIVTESTGPDPLEAARSAVRSAGGDAVLVVLDDVQAVENAAVPRIGRLVAAAPSLPILVLLAVRDGSGGTMPPSLGGLLGWVDQDGSRTVRLEPLAPQDVARIATAYVGPAKALAAALAVAETSRGAPGLVHAQVDAWARARVGGEVRRSAGTTSAEWASVRRGEAQLVDELLSLSAVTTAAEQARAAVSALRECPYPGLAAFGTGDAAYFSGREELTGVTLARLAVTGSVVVCGPSGVGKSSLVRAGVVPALAAGALPDSETWLVRVVTPTRGLPEPGAGTTPSLLVVDQLEELVSLSPVERSAVVRALTLAELASVRLLLVVRADHFAALAADPDLGRLLDRAPVQVGPMSARELARAVEVPVRRAGGRIGPDLVARFVDDLTEEPGGLPLLSITMRRVWDRSDDGDLTVESYEESGGVRNAVGRIAEESFGQLDAAQQQASRDLLLRMAAPGDNGSVVRAYVQLQTLGAAGPAQNALSRLTQDRLVVVDGERATVAHEALFTQWPRLAGWLADDAVLLAARARLSAAAASWTEGGRLEADLARGPRLDAATDLAGRPGLLSAEESEYVRASAAAAVALETELAGIAQAQRRSNRRLRALLAATVAALLVATAAAGVAVHLRGDSDRAATVALAGSAGAQSLTAGRLDVSLLLAAEAARLAPGPQARAALIASLARAPQARHVLLGSGERLHFVAVGGPGPYVVSVDRTGKAAVWDLAAGTRRSLPPAAQALDDAGLVAAAAFSPDRRFLALVGGQPGHPDRGQLLLLDAGSLRPVRPAVPLPSPAVAVAYGGDRLAVLTDDARVRLLDGTTLRAAGATIATGVRPDSLRAVSVSADGRRLAVDGSGLVWDLASGRPSAAPDGGSPVVTAAVSADGTAVAEAAGAADPEVRLLDARGLPHLSRLVPVGAGAVQSLAFSPDGHRLAVGTIDGTVAVVDTATGSRLESLRGHDGPVASVAFAADGRTLVTGGADGRAITWDLSAGAGLGHTAGTLAGIDPQALSQGYAAMSATAGRVLVGEPDGTVVIAAATGRELAAFPAVQPGGVNDAQVSRDGQLGATAGADDTVRLWDLVGARALAGAVPVRPPASPASVAISPDHRRLAVGDAQGGLTVFSLPGGQVRWHRSLARVAPGSTHGAVLIASFAPDGRTIAVSVSHVATELLPADGGPGARLLHAADDNSIAIAFSRDGRHLMTGDSDGSAHVWDPRTGSGLALGTTGATVASAPIYGASFDRDGSTVAIWAGDGSVRLWDVASGAAVGPSLTDASAGAAVAAAWQADGRLDTVQADGRVRVFPVSTADLVARACSVVGRPLAAGERAQFLPGSHSSQVCTPH